MRPSPDAVATLKLAIQTVTQNALQTVLPLLIRAGIRRFIVGLWFAIMFSLFGLPWTQRGADHGGANGARVTPWSVMARQHEARPAAVPNEQTRHDDMTADIAAGSARADREPADASSERRRFKTRGPAVWWL